MDVEGTSLLLKKHIRIVGWTGYPRFESEKVFRWNSKGSGMDLGKISSIMEKSTLS